MSTEYTNAWTIAQVLITGQLQQGTVLTREVIASKVDTVLLMDPAYKNRVDRERLIADLESSFTVWMGSSVTLENNEDHVAWLNNRKSSIEWKFWRRYQILLQRKRWAATSIDKLNELTDETLGRLEEPTRTGMWSRRGLVVGHVQSGKTANYTGLICKAADAGYKVIIVLAGIHKSLRSQTQIRLDEGFLGYESKDDAIDGATAARKFIGVGLIDPSISANTITTRADDGDFKVSVRRNFHIGPESLRVPLLFVVKKNARVLQNLNSWVERSAQKKITVGGVERSVVADVPLLVIDDEADHASIDTRSQEFDEEGRPDPDHDPTAINKQVRKLLHLFERSAYVGYTATPFANIFIHDAGTTDEYGADLFPKSFITNLPAPSDYVGPVRVFGLEPDASVGLEESEPLGLVRHISDHADSLQPNERKGWMPPVHKKEHKPRYNEKDEVPPSLRTALYSFVLSCSARRARGQLNEHNSMLVHVTRFTDAQELVFTQVKRALKELQDHLELGEGAGLTGKLDELRQLWEKDFIPTTKRINEVELPVQAWADVSVHLKAAVAGVKVKQINGTAGDVLDYEDHKATGLSVIAVGGDKLARGLTLEGLSVSYFLRASRMYDTLMQMGRWFGYRPGYLDLCRLYMTEELDEWFQHVTKANEELRQEFDRMAAVGGTPADYGLRVRSHPTLLVTSPVKMRNGVELQLSFAGDIVETTVFDRRKSVLEHNRATTVRFLEKLGPKTQGWTQSRPEKPEEWKQSYVWQQVPGAAVAAFLAELQVPEGPTKARGELLAEFIQKQLLRNELLHWTVVLIGRSGGQADVLAGLPINLTQREVKSLDIRDRYVIPRLVNPKDETVDLDAGAYMRAIELTKAAFHRDPGRTRRKTEPEVPSGTFIRDVRPKERGVLILYPLDPHPDYTNGVLEAPVTPIGWAVSFPGSKTAAKVSYRVNGIFWAQEYGGEA
ncbi:Z1 domain-containing protein [Archangium lansingense]|uniref:Z1 domain-containing protein n=1 Tax=Archangium lansingense TaxID=2995310 RepID=A0ABT3ZZI6_9BACT|nr:Z1 domain-containing protein [Archangium lansinium]MCY1074821.1 Z1 domain-containing protein [Archangium lansinium]